MNIRKLLCIVSAVAVVASTSASAQSLPELARIEKARRARLRAENGPARVYTEGNQSGTARDAAATESIVPAGPPAAEAAAGPKAKTPQELAAEKQAEWNERLAKAQAEIKTFEDAVATNERALASMFNITPARADLANRIEADKQKVVELRKTLTDLEDERRREGLPRVR